MANGLVQGVEILFEGLHFVGCCKQDPYSERLRLLPTLHRGAFILGDLAWHSEEFERQSSW